MNQEELKVEHNKMEWHEGSVKGFAGKQLIEQPNGGLKLVKVQAHCSYPTHLHPDKDEYAYVLKGHVAFEIGDQVFNCTESDFCIFPAKTKHAIHNHTAEEVILMVGAIRK